MTSSSTRVTCCTPPPLCSCIQGGTYNGHGWLGPVPALRHPGSERRRLQDPQGKRVRDCTTTLNSLPMGGAQARLWCLSREMVEEKRAAEKLMPLVKQHHWLLVTLLLCNALANEALPLFLDRLVPAWLAVRPKYWHSYVFHILMITLSYQLSFDFTSKCKNMRACDNPPPRLHRRWCCRSRSCCCSGRFCHPHSSPARRS